MACLNCATDNFINDSTTDFLRLNTTFTTPNGVALTQTTGGANPGISITKGAATQFFSEPSGSQVHHLNWGTPKNYIAVLTRNATQRSLVLVNTFSNALTTNLILFVNANSAMQGPFINYCKGEGGVIMSIWQNNFALWAADGSLSNSLCSGTSSTPAQVFALATATTLEIKNGATIIASCTKPVGKASVLPSATINFPDVIIGPGVPAALSTQTKQGKIKNTGNNCLTINNVADNPPYAVVPGTYSKTMPVTLLPGDELTFDILFNPGTITGSPFNRDLAINPAPAQGDTVLHCKGVAKAPQLKISTNSPLHFGTVKVGETSSPKTLKITNTGDADLTLLSFPGPTNSEFDWTAPPAPAGIAYGTSLDIPIRFRPTAEGNRSKSLSFTTNATGSPHNINLTGVGCVPRAVISLQTNPVNLGNVQKGFRTVRMFKVINAGNDVLHFDARIQASVPGDINAEADALLFGLLEDSNVPVTMPPQIITNITINPQSACGSPGSGTGEFIFGIAFFAGDAPGAPVPRTANAVLEIFNHNDSTPGTPSTFRINLTSVITNPVSVDVELVIDRSGSMADPSGTRIKIQTAIDAARLFVRLSRPNVEDRIGLVRFNDTPEVIPSFGIQPLTTASQLQIENQINTTNYSPSGATSVAGGVIVAQNDLRNNPRATVPPELNKVIIVLTDGIDNAPYTNPADGITYSLLGGFGGLAFPSTQALPVPTDLKIYAIGIGDHIDTGRLGHLAASTGGAFLQAKEFSGQDYFNLEKHFTQVYMEAVNYAQIEDPVYEILPGEAHRYEFEVLKGDKSAMVVIYDKEGIRVPFSVYTPKGEQIDLLSIPPSFQLRPGITATARFIEVNFEQVEVERYEGTWKIEVKHDKRACYTGRQSSSAAGNITEGFGEGFQPTECKENYDKPILYGIAIGVGSDLRMFAFVTPGIVKTGEPILLSAIVSECSLPVTGCVVNVKAKRPDGTITDHILFDDGNHYDDQADDGTYACSYPHTYQEGTYTFTFSTTGKSRDGKTIKREAVRSKYVEGRTPLVPNDPGGVEGGNNRCCDFISRWLRIGITLLLLILIVLIFIWRA